MPLPQRLKKDAILEALLEIRFETNELPELIVGYLIQNEAWKGFSRTRTPIADLPTTIRWSQADLRYQPILELRDAEGEKSIKIGERVISFHKLAPYNGWEEFSKELSQMVRHLFSKFETVKIERLGLRYINALRRDIHEIEQASDLNVNVAVNNSKIFEHFNLNYSVQHKDDLMSLSRIATPDYVEGKLPDNTSVYVDIDVFTLPGFEADSSAKVIEWVEEAHLLEKKIFFQFIPEEKLKKMVEK